ncbi:hypothetical protein [Klebsiella pneumoniae]|uniref:hypothetical protein n=1 Tax=Klebsiella pneumoniae TaxID=573 RepID=UPI00388D6ECA
MPPNVFQEKQYWWAFDRQSERAYKRPGAMRKMQPEGYSEQQQIDFNKRPFLPGRKSGPARTGKMVKAVTAARQGGKRDKDRIGVRDNRRIPAMPEIGGYFKASSGQMRTMRAQPMCPAFFEIVSRKSHHGSRRYEFGFEQTDERKEERRTIFASRRVTARNQRTGWS